MNPGAKTFSARPRDRPCPGCVPGSRCPVLCAGPGLEAGAGEATHFWFSSDSHNPLLISSSTYSQAGLSRESTNPVPPSPSPSHLQTWRMLRAGSPPRQSRRVAAHVPAPAIHPGETRCPGTSARDPTTASAVLRYSQSLLTLSRGEPLTPGSAPPRASYEDVGGRHFVDLLQLVLTYTNVQR
jgi:hypothetical protein